MKTAIVALGFCALGGLVGWQANEMADSRFTLVMHDGGVLKNATIEKRDDARGVAMLIDNGQIYIEGVSILAPHTSIVNF